MAAQTRYPTLALEEKEREWREWRRSGIGGSDAAAICGLDPFKTPMAVWLDKCGYLPPREDDDENEQSRWGHILEIPIAAEFEVRTGLYVIRKQEQVTHPQIPYMKATVDGFVAAGNRYAPPVGIYEAKTASGRAGDWETEDRQRVLPDRVQIQIQHNMAVTGLDRAWVAALLLSPAIELHIFPVARDEAAIETLLQIEASFWDRVIQRRSPPTDGSDSTIKALRQAYQESNPDKLIELDAEGMRRVRRRCLAVRDEKAAGAVKDAEDAALMALLGEAETATYEGRTVLTWRPSSQERIDVDELRKRYPDIAAQVSHKTTARRLHFKPLLKVHDYLDEEAEMK